jgi:hypothetical protein
LIERRLAKALRLHARARVEARFDATGSLVDGYMARAAALEDEAFEARRQLARRKAAGI